MTTRLPRIAAALALLGALAATSACSPALAPFAETEAPTGAANAGGNAGTEGSGRTGEDEGQGELEDLRYLSDGTPYEWDGELINYRAEWESFLASRPSLLALDVLGRLDVASKAPADGYDREEFGERWVDVDGNGCNTRNDILGRDLTDITYTSNKYRCIVKSGELDDPYSGERVHFERSESDAVQIDHIVALYNAWRTGAQEMSFEDRVALANDPYNLVAVDGDANFEKSDGDASQWLPAGDDFLCEYVARQVGVKARYNLWVTKEEKRALTDLLTGECEGTELPAYDAIR